MLQVTNSTPFAATLMVLPDVAGIDTVYAVVKGTFAIGARLTPADEQLPVTMADQHYADPATTNIRAPSDVCLGKPGTDVVLIGSAWSPDPGPPADRCVAHRWLAVEDGACVWRSCVGVGSIGHVDGLGRPVRADATHLPPPRRRRRRRRPPAAPAAPRPPAPPPRRPPPRRQRRGPAPSSRA